jgi:hypothetical protein
MSKPQDNRKVIICGMNNEDPIHDLERAAHADRVERQAHIAGINAFFDESPPTIHITDKHASQAYEAFNAIQDHMATMDTMVDVTDALAEHLAETDAYAERLERRNRVLLHVIWALSGTCALWMGIAIWSLT